VAEEGRYAHHHQGGRDRLDFGAFAVAQQMADMGQQPECQQRVGGHRLAEHVRVDGVFVIAKFVQRGLRDGQHRQGLRPEQRRPAGEIARRLFDAEAGVHVVRDRLLLFGLSAPGAAT
jgi:hypothetical protein